MATAQLSLNFSAMVEDRPSGIASDQEQTYAIAYLEKAYKLYSGSSLFDYNKIRGVFYHAGMPHACVGASLYWGLNEVFLRRLYSPEDWQSKAQEKPTERNYYWGREIQYRGATWIMGDRINLKPHPQERAIAVAQYKIKWSLDKLDRTMPYASGERRDPSWGIDYYQQQAEEARSLLMEGMEEARKLTVPVDCDRIQSTIQKLDKTMESTAQQSEMSDRQTGRQARHAVSKI